MEAGPRVCNAPSLKPIWKLAFILVLLSLRFIFTFFRKAQKENTNPSFKKFYEVQSKTHTHTHISTEFFIIDNIVFNITIIKHICACPL